MHISNYIKRKYKVTNYTVCVVQVQSEQNFELNEIIKDCEYGDDSIQFLDFSFGMMRKILGSTFLHGKQTRSPRHVSTQLTPQLPVLVYTRELAIPEMIGSMPRANLSCNCSFI